MAKTDPKKTADGTPTPPKPTPVPPVIDPARAYTRTEVAELLGKSEMFVQQLWDNWRGKIGPRMNFNPQAGRAPKLTDGANILDYLNEFGVGGK